MNLIKNQSVKKQIKLNFIVSALLSVIFYFIMCCFKKYSYNIILGIILGNGCGFLNFVLLAVSMEKLILLPESRVKTMAMAHYIIRYLFVALFIFLAIKLDGIIDVFSFIVSLFFAKLALFIQAFLED